MNKNSSPWNSTGTLELSQIRLHPQLFRSHDVILFVSLRPPIWFKLLQRYFVIGHL